MFSIVKSVFDIGFLFPDPFVFDAYKEFIDYLAAYEIFPLSLKLNIEEWCLVIVFVKRNVLTT